MYIMSPILYQKKGNFVRISDQGFIFAKKYYETRNSRFHGNTSVNIHKPIKIILWSISAP